MWGDYEASGRDAGDPDTIPETVSLASWLGPHHWADATWPGSMVAPVTEGKYRAYTQAQASLQSWALARPQKMPADCRSLG